MADKVLTINGKVLKINSSVLTASIPAPTEPDYLCFTAEEANSSVELCYTYANDVPIANTAYSRDKITWTTFTPVDYETESGGANKVVLTNVGDKVYFRNDFTNELGDGNLQFKMTGLIAASGNINSMYSSTEFSSLTTLSYSYCYSYMFLDCISLTTAPELPATTLADYCYKGMFYNCTSLTTAPELPATTLTEECYVGMFSGCASLQVSDTQTTEAQYEWRIPATGTFENTTTYNQRSMFSNCLGTRSSNTMSGAQGESHIYYTQNQPV